MKGNVLVVYDSNITPEIFIQKNQKFMESARKNGIYLEFNSNAEIYSFMDNGFIRSNSTLAKYNYALFFNSDTYLAKNLELLGVKVVNSSRAIELCQNKAMMYQTLTANKVAIPKTAVVPNVSNYSNRLLYEFVAQAIENIGIPMIIKNFYGESGQNVYLARTKQEVFDIVNKFNGKDLLLQEYIVESKASDVRLFVIKNKVVASIRRQGASGDFRSNLALGGVLLPYMPTRQDEELAISATRALGCEFAIVDLLKSVNGPLVCEVNSTANVNNFYNNNNVNIPELLFRNLK